jgi:hypothetical protein
MLNQFKKMDNNTIPRNGFPEAVIRHIKYVDKNGAVTVKSQSMIIGDGRGWVESSISPPPSCSNGDNLQNDTVASPTATTTVAEDSVGPKNDNHGDPALLVKNFFEKMRLQQGLEINGPSKEGDHEFKEPHSHAATADANVSSDGLATVAELYNKDGNPNRLLVGYLLKIKFW